MDASTPYLLAAALAIAVIGALAGTAGFAGLISVGRDRRIAHLLDSISSQPDPVAVVKAGGIRDRNLAGALDRVAERVADTWRLATIDPLTGVLNRQATMARLTDELVRAARYHRPLSIVLIDLDHFKRLNDSYGHAAGDRVLHLVAGMLAANVRTVDAVGRYGGEEFVIILPETDVDAAASIAEKLRRLVGSRSIELQGGETATVTLSAGVAGGVGGIVVALDVLLRDADAAMYSAKNLGRNQVYVFREVADDGPVRRAAIAPAARRRAVEMGRAAMSAAQEALTEALEPRAGWAGRPSALIAEAAVAVAQSIGLPDGEVERIRTASLLHDLGKIAIPDEILEKPGGLAEPEWRVIAEHPKIGQVVLEQAGALRDAATIVLHHHEWFDGRGYPHGLAGGEIPVGSRIVAIADAYEAMISGRPYRTAISHCEAIDELRRHAGLQFDPALVEVFAALFATGLASAPSSTELDRSPALAPAPGATSVTAASDTASIRPSGPQEAARRRASRTGTAG